MPPTFPAVSYFLLEIDFLLSRITRTSRCWDFQYRIKAIPANLKRVFPTNILHLHYFIPSVKCCRRQIIFHRHLLWLVPSSPVCGSSQGIGGPQLYIISTPEFLHHKKSFNWHLVPKNISYVSPQIQLFHFICGWPSLITDIFVRVYAPRCITVIKGNNWYGLSLV